MRSPSNIKRSRSSPARAAAAWHAVAVPACRAWLLCSPPVLCPSRARLAVGLGTAALLLVATTACSKDDKASGGTSTTSSTAAPSPSEVLASCTPAVGADFVAVERHLTHGGHQLREGFVSADAADGHYLAADVYDLNDQLLATGLLWRIAPDGSAMSADAATSAWSALPSVPATQDVDHPELLACVHAALASAG